MFRRNIHILTADAGRLPLPDAFADLIVTSPPYYKQREYEDNGECYPGQLGQEQTALEYVDNLVGLTAEWVRVLKPGGSMFVVLGDRYVSDNRGSGLDVMRGDAKYAPPGPSGYAGHELAPRKSLLFLPWRYAIACTDKLGLYGRAEIIWDKPNSLPESVQDRVRRGHEVILHFTKSERYYHAVDVIRGDHEAESLRRAAPHRAAVDTHQGGHVMDMSQACHPLGSLPRSVWTINTVPLVLPREYKIRHYAAFPPELPRRCILGWSPAKVCCECGEGRFPVIEMAPEGYQAKGGHTYEDMREPGAKDSNLAEAVIRGRRIVGYACACTPSQRSGRPSGGSWKDLRSAEVQHRITANGKQHVARNYPPRPPRTEYQLDGWEPPPSRPGIVLDPMGGTGTTAITAALLGRQGVTVDRSYDYGAKLVRWRMNDRRQMRLFLGGGKS